MSKTKGKGRSKAKKKEKKRKETEEQAPMRDYREALLADMKGLKAVSISFVCVQ